MRPIGKTEHKVTALAVRYEHEQRTIEELRRLIARGSRASDTERAAAKRVLRVRGEVV